MTVLDIRALTRPSTDGLALLVVALVSACFGLLLGTSTTFAALLVAGPALLWALLRAPIAALLAVFLAGEALIPSLLTAGVATSAVNSIGGPARFVLVVAVLALLRTFLERENPRIPFLVLVSIGSALLLLGYQHVVGTVVRSDPNAIAESFYGSAELTGFSAVLRSAYLPLAAIVGLLVAVQSAGRTLPYRLLGLVAAGVYIVSVLYYANAQFGMPVPGALRTYFEDAKVDGSYGSRSLFPFTSISPNANAIAFVLIGVIATLPLIRSTHRWDRQAGRVLVLLAVAAILSTQSRTGILTGATALVVCALVVADPHRRGRIGLYVVAVAVAYVFAAPLLLPADRQINSGAQTFVSRQELWDRGWAAFKDAPAFGRGYGFDSGPTFEAPALPSTRPARATRARAPSIAGTQSEFVAQLVNGGVVGIALFASMIGVMMTIGFRALRAGGRTEAAMLFGCLAASGVAATSTTLLTAPVAWALLWLAVGIAGGRSSLGPNTSKP